MCGKGLALLDAYQRAATAYAESVSEMFTRIGITPRHEYDQLRLASEVARKNSELAREALERHQREHSCQRINQAMRAG